MALTNIETEYEDFVKKNTWLLVFYEICRISESQNLTIIEAEKPHNKYLNRYCDVYPYDHTRVKLNRIEGDYINANYVNIPSAHRKYILTQGPLAYTVSHFWLMVWEQMCPGIVMLNRLIENNELNCEQYWPEVVASESMFEDVQLMVTLISEHTNDYYVVRKFQLQDLLSKATREVIQFHYMAWPDFEVPKSATQFLEFLNTVRISGILESDWPAVIHCSAGIGRSGTFCLVDSTLISMEKEGVDNVDPKEILKEMRKQRMSLIQTTEQFRFAYLAIIEGIKRFDPNYKKAPIEEEERSEDISILDAFDFDQTPAPPLSPASLETCPFFGPLSPLPVDSTQVPVTAQNTNTIRQLQHKHNSVNISEMKKRMLATTSSQEQEDYYKKVRH